MPKRVIHAFLSAEDKNFYEHGGLDSPAWRAPAWCIAQNFGTGRRPRAPHHHPAGCEELPVDERSVVHAQDQGSLARDAIERAYTKDPILELYLNEIYLGLGAYGIAAASLVYFDKSVNELTIAEASYLAALPKAPSALHPVRNRDRATERRNYVVDRMVENG